MPLTSATSTDSALQHIRTVLGKFDALPIPRSLRPRIETILVRQVAKMMDGALPWQVGHGRRTAALAQCLGSMAGISRESLHHLMLASLLHDIGLLAVPNRLHSQRRCLDLDSYASIQCHPRLGAQWLERFRFLRHAAVIIAHHHERWDGFGYPYGIRGTFIPLEARVLAIADAFDAVEVPSVSDPDVRDQVAYRIIKVAAGSQFDPHLVEMWPHPVQAPLDRTNPLTADAPESVSLL